MNGETEFILYWATDPEASKKWLEENRGNFTVADALKTIEAIKRHAIDETLDELEKYANNRAAVTKYDLLNELKRRKEAL